MGPNVSDSTPRFTPPQNPRSSTLRLMGLKEWAEQGATKAAYTGSFQGIVLTPDSITYKREGGPTAGVVATVDTGTDVRRRATATRVLAVGIFALAMKKQVGHVYLTVEGDGYAFMVEVPVKLEADARKFAAKVNTAGKRQT